MLYTWSLDPPVTYQYIALRHLSALVSYTLQLATDNGQSRCHFLPCSVLWYFKNVPPHLVSSARVSINRPMYHRVYILCVCVCVCVAVSERCAVFVAIYWMS